MQNTTSCTAINAATTLGKMAEMPGFCKFGGLLFACRPETWEKFRQLPVGMLGGDRVLDGLQSAQALLEQGFDFDLPLWPQKQIDAYPELNDTRLFHYPGRQGAPFVLVIPGGGYQSVCTFIEGFPAGAELARAGYHAFVLCYRVRKPALMPKPIEDAIQALRLILANTETLGVGTQYAVMGFSAGGHLAAELCTDNFGAHLAGLPRPRAAALCYAALDLRILGGNDTAEKFRHTVESSGPLEDFCINLHADAAFPSTILWQCEDDDTVSFENLRLMEKRLAELDVTHKAIAYQQGGHGLCKPHGPEADCWIDEVIRFLNQHLPL